MNLLSTPLWASPHGKATRVAPGGGKRCIIVVNIRGYVTSRFIPCSYCCRDEKENGKQMKRKPMMSHAQMHHNVCGNQSWS